MAHTGANYADTTTTSEYVELWFDGIRPDREILDAAIRVLKKTWVSSWAPVSMGAESDFDMSLSTDTDWTNVGSPGTSAKATTARRVRFGPRAYQLINASVNEGTRSTTLANTRSLKARIMAISSANVGTASLQLYNISGSADIGTAIVHSEESAQLMLGDWEVTSATTKEIAGSLIGQESSADIFWNALWIYQEGIYNLPLPSFVSEDYKAPFIFQAIPRQKNPTYANCYVAESIEYVPLQEGRDYHLAFNHGDAKPHGVNLSRGWNFDYPLVVQVRRPVFDYGSFTAETSTTVAPLLEFMPRFELELIDTVYLPKLGQDPKWAPLRAKAVTELNRATQNRNVTPIGPTKRLWGGLTRV